MISCDTRNFSGQSSKNNRQSRVSLHTIDFTIKLEEPLAESYNRSFFFFLSLYSFRTVIKYRICDKDKKLK